MKCHPNFLNLTGQQGNRSSASSHGTVSFCSPLSSAVPFIYLETVLLPNHFTNQLRPLREKDVLEPPRRDNKDRNLNWLHVKNIGVVTVGWVISVTLSQTLQKFIWISHSHWTSHLRWEYHKYMELRFHKAGHRRSSFSHPDPLNGEIPKCAVCPLIPTPGTFIEGGKKNKRRRDL